MVSHRANTIHFLTQTTHTKAVPTKEETHYYPEAAFEHYISHNA